MESGNKNTKFLHSIFKITPDRPKNTGTWGVNTTIVNTCIVCLLQAV